MGPPKAEEPSIYLLVGDEFLIRKEAEKLVHQFLPDAALGLNYSVLDGASPKEVAQDLATQPLFPGAKVVLVRDPEFLMSKKTRGDGLGKAKEAWRSGRRREAARRTLAFLARAGLSAASLADPASSGPALRQVEEQLGTALEEADSTFIFEVAAFCREERMAAPDGDVGPLLDLLKRGVAPTQVLILAASEVDAKNPLTKWVMEHGQVSEKQLATRLKDLDLSEIAQKVLQPLGKRLAPKAEALLKDRCGANMRLVQSELEKLALYSAGNVIEAADVDLLVARAREEGFLELSEALQKKELGAALRHVGDAMDQGSHPLQLLGTIASIVRGLLETAERLRQFCPGPLPRSFEDFKERVFPRIEEEAKANKQRVPHPYAAFMSAQAAARFSRGQLLQSLVACADADLLLKSSADGRLVLDRLLWTVSGATPPV